MIQTIYKTSYGSEFNSCFSAKIHEYDLKESKERKELEEKKKNLNDLIWNAEADDNDLNAIVFLTSIDLFTVWVTTYYNEIKEIMDGDTSNVSDENNDWCRSK